ncbi:hypothetical protein V866_002403 [Kwoniella sp. B9012]
MVSLLSPGNSPSALSTSRWNPQIPLIELLAKLPEPHPRQPTDLVIAFGTIFFMQLMLSTPHTGGWGLLRMGIVAPICFGAFTYLITCQVENDDITHWGGSILSFIYMMRILEYFVFFPPEQHCHRIIPRSQLHPPVRSFKPPVHDNDHRPSEAEGEVLIPEAVPQPFTLAKFYWAGSLIWSYRGIGWAHQCPLPRSSTEHPYTRKSSFKEWLKIQLPYYIATHLMEDLCRAIRNVVGKDFFSGPDHIPYDSLSQSQRALYSIAVVSRVHFGLILTWFHTAVCMIVLGKMLGWKGELWEPWGWPPMFGSLENLWVHPGLSTMWSKTWHGYNRRWLYVLGWIGIGENILGLTHTGISSHPSIPPQPEHQRNNKSSGTSSPSESGRVSPSHPIASSSSPNGPNRAISTKLVFSNLIKSFITFLLSGLNHDAGSLALLIKNHPRTEPVYLNDLFRLTPFFILQPVGLALEALVKSIYRSNKKRFVDRGKEPSWLVFTERLIGFVWTWTWLGWTARYFVEGMAHLGAYRRDGDKDLYFSLWGGLVWGKWMI